MFAFNWIRIFMSRFPSILEMSGADRVQYQGAVLGDHMGRCSATNLPLGEEEKGPQSCMSVESIDWPY